MAQQRLIAENRDTLVFERAFIADSNGVPVPRAIVGGVLCNIDTKPGPLADGLAFCEPVDPRLAEDWPLYLDTDHGRLWNFTRDPSIVAAARRFARMNATGRAHPGQRL